MRGLDGEHLNLQGLFHRKAMLKGIIPVLLWMLIIFFFSAQDGKGSASLSASFIRSMVDILFAIAAWFEISFTDLSAHSFSYMLHGFIRKVAHFFLYTVLGFLLLRYFLHQKVVRIAFILALCVGICYASFDEYHQTLVVGRSGTVSDVLLDSSGVAFGVLMYFLVTVVQRKMYSAKDW